MVNEKLIVIEYVSGGIYRGIVFDVDEETGAKSVYDIIEGNRRALPKLLQQRAERDGIPWDYKCETPRWSFHLGQTKTIEAQVRRIIDCREGDAPTMTKADAAKIGREIGMTIKWDSEWNEFAVYPKGTGRDHPSAYFTSDVEDAVATARSMANADE